ncbi:MAG: hypothetical protein B7X99_08900 [Rhizobiales bacterium 17-65-6]|nr:MAG: hypothetical protein B7X99_08900 [Rhizobiales bacterium 17-65-6]
MSTSSRKPASQGARGANAAPTEFDIWLQETFDREGSFTALVVLVRIGELKVDPLASTFVNFIGDEVRWPAIVTLFAGSGKTWDGAVFFPVLDSGGLLLNAEARSRLRALEAKVREDRLTINTGAFFDAWGRRMKVEEVLPN